MATTPRVHHIGGPGFCVSCRPGHVVHFIHARLGLERSIPLEVNVDVDARTGTVRLDGLGVESQVWRNHDPRRLAEALRLSEGRAVWLREYHLLQTPGRAGESYLFNLARPQQWVPCLPPKRPPDTYSPKLQTAPGVFCPPPTGEHAEAWAKAVVEALARDWNRSTNTPPTETLFRGDR